MAQQSSSVRVAGVRASTFQLALRRARSQTVPVAAALSDASTQSVGRRAATPAKAHVTVLE
ncbi:hypothetical protein ASD62_19335 [Phycicoccus sp. Root563]|nr:hypothetical protein ASD62_19335 [Phycicoccus sp. Root563]